MTRKDDDRDRETAVGNSIRANRGRWSFGGAVADSFVPHIRQSVPFYEEGHDLVCALSDFFLRDDSVCYELGTSTGELLSKLAKHQSALEHVSFVGIDNEPPMIEAASARFRDDPRVSLLCEDVVFADFPRTDLILSYYAIQFIHPKFRQDLIDKIYQSLNWGGAFVVFEKVRGSDARFQDIQSLLYTKFKRDNGFSDTEILNKSFSLNGIMEPFNSSANHEMYRRAGFQDIMTVFRWLCFEGVLCIK